MQKEVYIKRCFASLVYIYANTCFLPLLYTLMKIRFL